MRSTKQRSQRLVLACAYFDREGKLMVRHDGILPNTEITNHYVERVGRALTRAHSSLTRCRLLERTIEIVIKPKSQC